MAEAVKKETKVSVRVPGDIMLPDPLGANFFHFTSIGTEVQFLVGSVNLINLHEAKQGNENTVVVPEITHRFLLSPLGFAQLKAQVEQISSSVAAAGVGIQVGKK